MQHARPFAAYRQARRLVRGASGSGLLASRIPISALIAAAGRQRRKQDACSEPDEANTQVNR
jgi:hypothetical protein